MGATFGRSIEIHKHGESTLTDDFRCFRWFAHVPAAPTCATYQECNAIRLFLSGQAQARRLAAVDISFRSGPARKML